MAEYLSPGVYVEGFDSRLERVSGVETNIAGFVGAAHKGSVEGNPLLVRNFSEFKRIYGRHLSESVYGSNRYLAYAVEHFFINGGSRAFIMRVAAQDAVSAEKAIPEHAPLLHLKAKNPGVWGNDLRVVISPSSKARTQIRKVLDTTQGKAYLVKSGAGFNQGDMVVFTDGDLMIYNRVSSCQDNIMFLEQEMTVDVIDENLFPKRIIATCELNMEVRYEDIIENYDFLSLNPETNNYLERNLVNSELITAACVIPAGIVLRSPFSCLTGGEGAAIIVRCEGGSDGSAKDMTAADYIGEKKGEGGGTGIQAFLNTEQVSIMAVPGVTDPDVQHSLIAHCENLANRFAVLDIPEEAKTIPDIIRHRELFDSSYGAMYHPWLEVFDPLEKKEIAIPPSGSILGIYARSDDHRGVHKAPANEMIHACIGLDMQFREGEYEILNCKGVNLIRPLPGKGIRVWGARTMSNKEYWRYINVRRIFIFLEASIKDNLKWVEYEPNEELLWGHVKRTLEGFLSTVWQSGALAGSQPSEAFFVEVGRSCMTQDDIDHCRLICVIGVAPIKPAEFIIFRITKKTAGVE